MKLLLTGFEPFGGQAVNPSWEAVRHVNTPGVTLMKAQLPVVWGMDGMLCDLLVSERPDAVLLCGQAGGAQTLLCERVGLNLCQGQDNIGETRNGAIIEDGPAAYFSTLPMQAICEGIRAAGIPAQVSLSAGAYLCNYALYNTLHLAATRCLDMRAGFLHVPFIPAQVLGKAAPSMSIQEIAHGMEAAVETMMRI